MNEKQNLNTAGNQQLNISDVSGSTTVIEPIRCELSDNMKAYIEMIEWVNDNFHKYAIKSLMIPKQMFGK